MRRLVKRQGLRQQAESGVTSQVPEAKLACLIRQALRSKTPIQTAVLTMVAFSFMSCTLFNFKIVVISFSTK